VVRVGLIVASVFQAMSFAPFSVFETANFALGERRYEVRVISETGGHAKLVWSGNCDRTAWLYAIRYDSAGGQS
jgi:hypothetical protein